jgi:hypothetical protein
MIMEKIALILGEGFVRIKENKPQSSLHLEKHRSARNHDPI